MGIRYIVNVNRTEQYAARENLRVDNDITSRCCSRRGDDG